MSGIEALSLLAVLAGELLAQSVSFKLKYSRENQFHLFLRQLHHPSRTRIR
jgi:hypothetical protein